MPHETTPPPTQTEVSAQQFKDVFRRHAAGVAVITLQSSSGPVGFTATSVISVSAAPPVLAFSIDPGSSSWPAIEAATTVVVNFLAHDQAALSARFATHGIDRFDADDWSELPTGEPVLHGTQAWVRGRVLDRLTVGTSRLVALHALSHRGPRDDAEPLVYLDRRYPRLDLTP